MNRYELESGGKLKNFSPILKKLQVSLLSNAYKIISEYVNEAEKYIKTWLSYQALWDIQIDQFYSMFGKDLSKWQKVLNEIKQGRNTFDNSEIDINFGPIVVNYKMV